MERLEITLAEDSAFGKQGERVTLALQPSDVHDPTELPTYLAGYRPFDMRADEASPVVLVDKDEDKYRQFSSDDAFRRVNVKGSLNGAVPEVDPHSSLTNYKVVDRYVGSFVGRVTQQQVSNVGYDPLLAAARRCRRAIELDRELDVWGLLGTDTNWDTSVRTAIAGGSEWDAANDPGDPIKDIQVAMQKSGQTVTEIWMNQAVAHAFLRHSKVRNHMRQLLGDSPVPQASNLDKSGDGSLADFRIPGLPPIKVVGGKYKSESTGLLQYVLAGDSAILLHRPPGVPTDGEEISSSYTFRRRGPSGMGFEARQYFIDGRGPYGGTMVVVAMADIAILTGPIAGGIITNCLS